VESYNPTMLQESELARRAGGMIETRKTPLRLQWDFLDLATSDGQMIRARFSSAVGVLSEALEQKMLVETFLVSKDVATANQVKEHFSPSMRTALVNFCSRLTAEDVLSQSGELQLLQTLCDAAKAVAFSCGLEMLAGNSLELDCPAIRQQKTAQRRSVEQTERLHQTAGMFAEFQKIRASAPELSAGRILQQIGAFDQAELLRSMVESYANKFVWETNLVAVAGSDLIQMDLKSDQALPVIHSIPQDLGPLRSIRGGWTDRMLVGARQGVWIFDLRLSGFYKLSIRSMDLQLGFNAAASFGERIWATHGEAGLMSWDLEHPDAPTQHGDLHTAKNLVKIGDHQMLFSSGGQIFLVDGDFSVKSISSPTSADVLAIFAEKDRVLAVHDDGMISIFDANHWEDIRQIRRGGRLTSAGILPWLGETRLLLGTETGNILCVSVDDEMVTQFASAHVSPRVIAACGKCVAALTVDRQKVVLWNSWDGRQPKSEVNLAALAKHRVADLVFISSD
jgi:hypothetical protein